MTCVENKEICASCNVGYKLVNGKCKPDFFIKAIYETVSPGETIKLFTSYDCVIQVIINDKIYSRVSSLFFENPGKQTILIKIKAIYSGYIPFYRSFFNRIENLISVSFSSFDEYLPDLSFEYIFKNCIKLTSVDLSQISIKLRTYFTSMFEGCINLSYLNFNPKITMGALNLENTFLNCKSLKFIDVSKIDVSSVSNFISTFQGCTSLQNIINITSWNLSSARDTSCMFCNCKSLKHLDCSFFQPRALYNMNYMFYNCYSLTSLNLDKFYVSNVVYMDRLFFNCTSLKLINLTSFYTKNVKHMQGMFENCKSVTSIIFGQYFMTDNIFGNMSYFFAHCHSLKSIDLKIVVTSPVYELTSFFSDCYSLTSINVENFDTSSTNNMDYMFHNCYNLKNINVSNFRFRDNYNIRIRHMFSGCYSLTSIDFQNKLINIYSYNGIFHDCPNLHYINLSFVSNYNVLGTMFNNNISSYGIIILNSYFIATRLKNKKFPDNWTVINK